MIIKFFWDIQFCVFWDKLLFNKKQVTKSYLWKFEVNRRLSLIQTVLKAGQRYWLAHSKNFEVTLKLRRLFQDVQHGVRYPWYFVLHNLEINFKAQSLFNSSYKVSYKILPGSGVGLGVCISRSTVPSRDDPESKRYSFAPGSRWSIAFKFLSKNIFKKFSVSLFV